MGSAPISDRLRLDLALGWYHMRDVTVTDSSVERPTALRPPSTVDNVTLGNGHYSAEAAYAGVGVNVALD